VVPKPTGSLESEALRAELLELCRKKLRSSRMPETIELVGSLPMTDTGKVRRRELLALLKSQEGPDENSR
jgi:acyl-coenzyme A synthetase/AMP-(fatty) acid ligase